MKKRYLLSLFFFLLFVASLSAQQDNVGINTSTPHSSAALQIDSKNNNQGVLIPRLSSTQRTGISSPATGLMVYDSTIKSFWYFDGTNWEEVGSTSKIKDADSDTSIEAIDGTSDTLTFNVDGASKWLMLGDRIEEGNTAQNIFIGNAAGVNNTVGMSNAGSLNTFIGSGAGQFNSTGQKNTLMGWNAGFSNTSGNHNTFIGENAGYGNTMGGINICIGPNSGNSLGSGSHNVFIGGSSGHDNTKMDNVFIGSESGFSNNGNKNIFIGRSSGSNETGSEKLYIENSSSASPLIYGEFDNNLLRINGTLNINSAFSFPTTDGTANQVLETDGSGNLSWVAASGGTPSKIEDADSDTSVEAIDGTGNTDRIEFTVDNTLQWEMKKQRLEEANGDQNIYIGKNAGSTNAAGVQNVYVGSSTGGIGNGGSRNTFLGQQSGEQITGNNNTLLGYQAGGGVSSDGSGNVFLGNKAGFNATGSNKLYIENTDIPNPLIYGEFDNDLLRINGTLNINDAFSFPTTDGTANQVLETDGSGNLSWVAAGGGTSSKIEDADSDTSVEALDGTGNTDTIAFIVNDTLQWRMVNDRIEQTNIFDNIFIGTNTGRDNIPNTGALEGTDNIFLGSNAGAKNTIGNSNIFLGNYSGFVNIDGAENTFLGSSSGQVNTSGSLNCFLGYLTGANNTSGIANTFVGRGAGPANETGIFNVFLGTNSGFTSNADNNVYIGTNAGFSNATGAGNIFIGKESGYFELDSNKLYIENSDSNTPLIYGEFDNNLLRVNGTLNINNAFSFPTSDGTANQVLETDGSGNLSWVAVSSGTSSKIEDGDSDTSVEAIDGSGSTDKIEFTVDNTLQWEMKKQRLEEANGDQNIYIGKNTGSANAAGVQNVFVGSSAGGSGNGGSHNTFLGQQSGELLTGNDNTFVGYQAGGGVASDGNGNVFLGNKAGYNTTGSNQLMIENTDAPVPLIYGNFQNDLVGINRIATTNALEVEGEASKTTAGSWVGNSDARLKKNIEQLDSETILQQLLQLKGVNYEWNDNTTGAQRPEGKQYGFIAQNIQEVFPELVEEDKLGYLQTAYGTYDAMQIEAIRALVNRIEKLEKENQTLKVQWEELAALKMEIEVMKGQTQK